MQILYTLILLYFPKNIIGTQLKFDGLFDFNKMIFEYGLVGGSENNKTNFEIEYKDDYKKDLINFARKAMLGTWEQIGDIINKTIKDLNGTHGTNRRWEENLQEELSTRLNRLLLNLMTGIDKPDIERTNKVLQTNKIRNQHIKSVTKIMKKGNLIPIVMYQKKKLKKILNKPTQRSFNAGNTYFITNEIKEKTKPISRHKKQSIIKTLKTNEAETKLRHQRKHVFTKKRDSNKSIVLKKKKLMKMARKIAKNQQPKFFFTTKRDPIKSVLLKNKKKKIMKIARQIVRNKHFFTTKQDPIKAVVLKNKKKKMMKIARQIVKNKQLIKGPLGTREGIKNKQPEKYIHSMQVDKNLSGLSSNLNEVDKNHNKHTVNSMLTDVHQSGLGLKLENLSHASDNKQDKPHIDSMQIYEDKRGSLNKENSSHATISEVNEIKQGKPHIDSMQIDDKRGSLNEEISSHASISEVTENKPGKPHTDSMQIDEDQSESLNKDDTSHTSSLEGTESKQRKQHKDSMQIDEDKSGLRFNLNKEDSSHSSSSEVTENKQLIPRIDSMQIDKDKSESLSKDESSHASSSEGTENKHRKLHTDSMQIDEDKSGSLNKEDSSQTSSSEVTENNSELRSNTVDTTHGYSSETTEKEPVEGNRSNMPDSDKYSDEKDTMSDKQYTITDSDTETENGESGSTLYNYGITDKPHNSPRLVSSDADITAFTYLISLNTYETLKEMKAQATSKRMKKNVNHVLRSYLNDFIRFANETSHQKILTLMGKQRVILSTLDTSSTILKRLRQKLVDDIQAHREKGITSRDDEEDEALATALEPKIQELEENNHVYACHLGICRAGKGFTQFLIDITTEILKCDDVKLEQFRDALAANMREGTNIWSDFAKSDLENLAKTIENAPIIKIRFGLKIWQYLMMHRNENKPLVVRVSSIMRQACRSVAFFEVIDLLEDTIKMTESNRLESEEIKREVREWAAGGKNDIKKIVQRLMSFIYNSYAKMDNKKLKIFIEKINTLIRP